MALLIVDSLEKRPPDGIVDAISSVTVTHKNDSLLGDAVASYDVIRMAYISLENTRREITTNNHPHAQ